MFTKHGDILAIIVVCLRVNYTLEFPPKESFRKKVNFESLNGTNLVFSSTKALITVPSVVKDLIKL